MSQRAVRLLIAASNAEDFQRLRERLSDADGPLYSITWSQRADEIVTQLRGQLHDACVIDGELDGSSAEELVARARHAGSTVPIVVIGDESGGGDGDELPPGATTRGGGDRRVLPAEETLLAPAFTERLPRRHLRGELLDRTLRFAVRHAGALRQLQDARERHILTERGADDGIWDWDLERDEVHYSERWKLQLGHTGDEIGSSPAEWIDRIHADDVARWRHSLEEHLVGRTNCFRREARILHRNGEYRWMLCRGSAFWRDGRPVRVAGTQTDISDRKAIEESLRETEERLRQAQKLESIGRFAGSIAHDFNNLLLVMLGYTGLLLDRLDESHEARGDLLEIQKAGEQASVLTRKLLSMSRKGEARPTEVDVNRVVTDLQSMLQRLIGEDIHLRAECTTEPMLVHADPGQIEQILLNLAANARDAMPSGGELWIGTRGVHYGPRDAQREQIESGSYVRLEVADSGEGMDRDTLSRVFEPFFTTKPDGLGSGLGCATVFGIVESCQGHVRVHSQPGAGTHFEVLLPRVRGGNGGDGGDALAPELARLSGARRLVLVVEDSEMVRGLVARILKSYGYRVLTARDAEEAFETATEIEGEIDLLLTDVVMPGLDGRELSQRLRRGLPDLRVLYMSGYPGERLHGLGVASGADDFIAKPFTAEQLAEKVHSFLNAERRESR